MKRKNVYFVTMMLLATMLLGGCGGAQSTTATKGSNGKLLISDKKIPLSIFCIESGVVFENRPVFQQAQEMTNIALTGTIAKSVTDEEQALNMMMASGDIADIIVNWKENFNKYGSQKALIPLNDLIDKYAPNIKAFLEENPDVKKTITAGDGNIYYIPHVADGDVSKTWFIREDWLEKLNLPMPKTVDEYYNALKAFKTKDPNGNGKADEIPYFNRAVGANYVESVTDLLMLWGAHSAIYADGSTIKYGEMEPEYKVALKNISKWYKEGLIDQQIYTRSNARDTLLINNTGGSTHDWCGSTAEMNGTVSKSVQGFELAVMAPPGGKEFSRREKLDRRGWGISIKNKNPEESIKYFDFWFTEEGRRLINFGVEGSDYTMVDGKPKFTDKILKGEKTALAILRDQGAQTTIGHRQDFEYEKQWLNQTALDGIYMYMDNKYLAPPAANFERTPEEEKRRKTLSTALFTYKNEQMQKWILGEEDVDSTYDAFIQGLKDLNVQELIEIDQKSYEAFLNK